MAEQDLDDPDVDAILEQMGGEAVAQRMRPDPLGDARHARRLGGDAVDLSVADRLQVVLTGEAYFEVTRNKEKPFIVMVGGIRVNVLGTHFNVNAYPEEKAVKTTLLEGSVRINKGNITGLLKPGQQGILDNDKTVVTVSNADIEEVMAWKNGLFQFDGADITTIMEEIARWYDVDVAYPGKVPMHRFQGKISREAQLSDVLRILELSNVKFTVTGKKIIVQ